MLRRLITSCFAREAEPALEQLGTAGLLAASGGAAVLYAYFGAATLIRALLGKADLDFDHDIDMSTHGYRGGDDEPGYLTPEEIKRFEQQGFIGPFKAFERSKALEMARSIRADVMDGEIIYGRFHELGKAERDAKQLQESIVERGWYRHLNVSGMYDALTHPAVGKKVASLLGEDINLWRSQCFEVLPGTGGTGLHNAEFLQGTVDGCLRPPPGRNRALVNLTVWMALTDATLETGALTFIPGSHTTNLFSKVKRNYYAPFDYFFRKGLRPAWELATVVAANATLGGPKAHFTIADYGYRKVLESAPTDKLASLTAVPVRAGEFLIFTSAVVHGSTPNTTSDQTRFAVAGRYARTDVAVYPDTEEHVDDLHFLPQVVKIPVEKLGVTLVHGHDTTGINLRGRYRPPVRSEVRDDKPAYAGAEL